MDRPWTSGRSCLMRVVSRVSCDCRLRTWTLLLSSSHECSFYFLEARCVHGGRVRLLVCRVGGAVSCRPGVAGAQCEENGLGLVSIGAQSRRQAALLPEDRWALVSGESFRTAGDQHAGL